MGKFILAAAIVGGTLTAIPAWADRDHFPGHGTGPVPMTTDAMTRKVNDIGYDVRRLEAKQGRYEAHLVDRESGGGVKAHFDGRSGELLRAEPSH